MSLLCGCAGKSSSSPQHRRQQSSKMSRRIKPPSSSFSSRFGFRSNTPTSTISTELHQDPPPPPPSTTKGTQSSKPTFAEVLTLSPSSLLRESRDYCHADDKDNVAADLNSEAAFVPRLRPRNLQDRPMSSIVTISQTEGLPVESTPTVRAVDDTNPSGRFRAGLRSFLSRPFTRTTAGSKSSPAVSGLSRGSSSGSINHSGSRSSLKPTAASSSPAKKSVNHRSSPVHSSTNSPNSHRRHNNNHQGGGAKFAAQRNHVKGSGPGATRMAPAGITALSNSSIDENNRQNIDSSTRYQSYTVESAMSAASSASTHCVSASSSSPVMMRGNSVKSGIPASNTGSAAPTATAKSRSSTTSLQSSVKCNSNQEQRRKPTIEICPLAKHEASADLDGATEANQSEGNTTPTTPTSSGLKRLSNPLSSRLHQIDEETLSSILTEISVLRSSLVELQHHLIGKQEHEDKMREELRKKNEVILRLRNQLKSCSCTKVLNGLNEADLLITPTSEDCPSLTDHSLLSDIS